MKGANGLGRRPQQESARGWTRSLATLGLCLVALACGDAIVRMSGTSPAVVTDESRDTAITNDFARFIFVPSGVVPTELGLPTAARVFVSASIFFEPPVSVEQTVSFAGIPDRADRDLVVLRCSPPDAARLDPLLATWPNLFTAIRETFEGQFTCPPNPGSPENELYCLARDYVDEPSSTLVEPLAKALDAGVAAFASDARAQLLQTRFGIYRSFSGLGLTVKGTGDSPTLTAAEALRRSVVPEYLLRNATLADAGCYCILVPPYPGRDSEPLDLDFVVERGGYGECRTIDRLRGASR